jgi:hypothetical protein
MAIKVCYNTFLSQTCGVGEIGVFREHVIPNHWEGLKPTTKDVVPKGGAGWVICSFTNDPVREHEYKQAYKELCKRWKLVYQSPVRKNNRTNKLFFFCIFDSRSKP